MNLIFIAQYTHSNGGMMQSLKSLLLGLTQTDHNIYVVVPANSQLKESLKGTNITFIQTISSDWSISKKSLLTLIKNSRQVYNQIKTLLKDGIIITNDLGASIFVSAMLHPGIPEIFVSRGGNYKGNGLGGFFMRNKLRFGLIKHTVVISESQRNIVNRLGVNLNKITLIHNGLKLPEKQLDYKGIEKNNFIIGTIGFIADGKNQIEGVKLIEMLREKGINAYLNIYGSVSSKSDEHYYKKLLKFIEKRGLTKYVNFKGFVSDSSKFAESSIIISFSKSEGFGRTIAEAMLNNRPVIACREAGGPIDITLNGQYGYLVEHNEAEEYCDICLSLFENQENVKKNVAESYIYASQHFTEDIMINKFIKLFKSKSYL